MKSTKPYEVCVQYHFVCAFSGGEICGGDILFENQSQNQNALVHNEGHLG